MIAGKYVVHLKYDVDKVTIETGAKAGSTKESPVQGSGACCPDTSTGMQGRLRP